MAASQGCTPITVHGRQFKQGDARFVVRGVVYQVANKDDPIADDCLSGLQEDIKLFIELGLNTIYVYTIDPNKAHGRAMKLLEDAGIYVVAGIKTPKYCINRLPPLSSYTSEHLQHWFSVMDTMAVFNNTLGLFSGNSVINSNQNKNGKSTLTGASAPVLKAVARDLKRYMALKHSKTGLRVLPLGYAASMMPENITVLRYLASGSVAERLDFWACCNYSWISPSSLEASEYGAMIEQYSRRDVPNTPVFFSEYGGRHQGQARPFDDTTAIYSPPMLYRFSGGCVYEFFQSVNEYGLVEFCSSEHIATEALRRATEERRKDVVETRSRTGGEIMVYRDFVNLMERLAAAAQDVADAPAVGEVGELGSTSVAGASDPPTAHTAWPWEPEHAEPKSCVDWAAVEESIGGLADG
ncbi:hypothetical protein CLAFUR4_03755 [Fulvia fulva]|nr:hypothetical protein CLAFUR4_03755 [Fulvia fulva]WPV26133.1 hypothetical protein CLAFUW7_03759 [Fulvia fulva]